VRCLAEQDVSGIADRVDQRIEIIRTGQAQCCIAKRSGEPAPREIGFVNSR